MSQPTIIHISFRVYFSNNINANYLHCWAICMQIMSEKTKYQDDKSSSDLQYFAHTVSVVV